MNKDGEKINLSSHLVEGRENVVFFHAPWSKTSSRYKVELEKWTQSNKDVAVFLVEVKNLKSPVAKQFHLTSVPAFSIYDGEGKLLASGQEAHNEVTKMLGR
jgi:thioredoxin-like negative regulator of GroEL